MKKFFLFGGLAVALYFFLSLPFLFDLQTKDFSLNQFEIQSNEFKQGTISGSMFLDWLRSYYALLWQMIFNPPKLLAAHVDFGNPDSVFTYLFERFPSYAIVYPTETYYYYNFSIPGATSTKLISGNMRFTNIHENILHMGYFDKKEPHGDFGFKSFSESDGVTVKAISPSRYKVSYKNKDIVFKLNDIFTKPPKHLKTLPEEEFVAHIQDEAGVRLFLYFNNRTKSFYYILDEENGVPEKLTRFGDNYLRGERTSYVFYEDGDFERKILVGVLSENIFSNNFFDGPFDQVPPRLQIRDKLLAAYPYTGYDGGIDEHGNFLGFQKGSRVAISPYYDYTDENNLLEYTKKCDEKKQEKSEYWSCLVYETKKDFHKQLEAQNYGKDLGHFIYVSQGWPADHYGDASRSWPEDHVREESISWSPNHEPNLSQR